MFLVTARLGVERSKNVTYKLISEINQKEKIMKGKNVIGIITLILALSLNSVIVRAEDNSKDTLAIFTATTEDGTTASFQMNRENVEINTRSINNDEISEAYSVIVEMTPDGTIRTVDQIPPQTRTTIGGSGQNLYWKGYVNITYTLSGSSCTFSRVDGYWTQLRHTSTLSDRSVYYAVGGKQHKSATKYPTSNNFAYNTGFSAVNPALEVGARSTVYVTPKDSTLRLKLEAEVRKVF